jgi:c-di-GMP-binding flagellar brake protein YcgR
MNGTATQTTQEAVRVEIRLPNRPITYTGLLQGASREAFTILLQEAEALNHLAPGTSVRLYIHAREASYEVSGVTHQINGGQLMVRLSAPPRKIDRRARKRYRIQMLVYVALPNEERGFLQEVITAQGIDISRGGMRLLLSQPVEVGQLLRLQFSLLNVEQPIQTVAEVRYVRPQGANWWVAGVRFVDMPRVDANWLARLFP